MPATTVKLGPGKLQIGLTGTEVDFECQITAAHVDWSADEGDSVVVLCGETVPGARTYSAVLAGTLLQDLGVADGIVAYSWANKGETVPFVFVPSDSAGQAVTGSLIVDPLSVGGDESGQNMTSDFEWVIVGDPILGAAPVGAAAARSGQKAPAAAAA